MQNYVEVRVNCPEEYSGILIQEMSLAGFDSFVENESGFQAYIAANKYDPKETEAIQDLYAGVQIYYTVSQIKNENWNKKWEENYEAVVIKNKYRFRAPFHQPVSRFEKEFIVYPGMAFGTGHHETTSLMIEAMDDLDFYNKSVLDYGCGTCILSIFTEFKGAREILAIDNDENAVESAKKNLELNNCQRISIQSGSIDTVTIQKYNIILANITRNIILNSKKVLKSLLSENGKLVISGFLEQDIALISQSFQAMGFTSEKISTKNKWALCIFAV